MNKFIHKLSIISTIILLSFLFVNCGDDDNPTEAPGKDPELIGKWEAIEAYIPLLQQTITPADIGYTASVTFKENGDFEIEIVEGQLIETDTGTWSTTNGVITMVSSDGSKESLQYTVNGSTGVIKNWPIDFSGVQVVADVTFSKV
jgi:hypothetical protein